MTNEYSADLAPILEAIADRAARLCESQDARIVLVDGDCLRYVAGFGEVPFSVDEPTRPLTRGLATGRAVIDRAVVHVEDMAAAEKEFPESHKYQRRSGNRTALAVPLVRGDKALGAILLRRNEVRPFDSRHIELVKVFADQAAVAIENLRLSSELKARNAELTEALEQQTATAEILKVISSSPTDIQPVLDAVAESAARLCGASDAVIRRVDGDVVRVVAHHGAVPLNPDGSVRPLALKTVTSRAIGERRTIHVHDMSEPRVLEEYPDIPQALRPPGRVWSGTMLVVPLLREDTAIGVINIRRPEVRPFSDKQIKLLETFAAQAVIAIENVRLFNETKEALEQQTATAEILKVISSSPTDIQPVLDAVAENAARLCGADDVMIRRADGDSLRLVAHVGPIETVPALPMSTGSAVGRAVMDRRTIHIHDSLDEQACKDFPDAAEIRRQFGIRTMLAAPLLREGIVVGAIGIRRVEVRPFSDREIKLLETFAAQAVIAIENVRLFNETKEALEQQTATAEILKVISSSPTDVQPVFDAIVKTGVRLFGGLDVVLRLVTNDQLVIAASTIPNDSGNEYAMALDDRSMGSRAVLRRHVLQAPDITNSDWDWIDEAVRRNAARRGIRAVLVAPMLRENASIGAIVVTRATPGPFSEKQVALLKTFADQAVIAIENVRLFNETKEALEQQTVISEILRVISSSPTDVQPVFDAIVKAGLHLFGGSNVSLRLIKGNQTEMVASTLPIPVESNSPLDDDGVPSSRAILRREVVQVPDMAASHWISDEVKRRAESRGTRAVLVAPMLRDNNAIGTILVNRATPGQFSDKQVALLKTFSDQAVIAIENVRLFKELQARNAEITESLEQQTATAEILRVISNSPTDIQPVLNAVAESAARLCEARDVMISRVDSGVMRVTSHIGPVPFSPGAIVRVISRGSFNGRAILERRTIHIQDVLEPHVREEYPEAPVWLQPDPGYRTILVVPLVREDTAIGTIVIRRPDLRPFSDKQIKLLETFAAQAVIAIENVRLFNETKEALEQQTATAEILKVISSSPTDTQPVFDAIVHSGRQLFRGLNVSLRVVKGEYAVRVASTSQIDDPSLDANPISDEGFPGVRAMLCREVVQVPDVFADEGLHERIKRRAEQLGFRAVMAAPMLRESNAVGAITVTRATTGLFTGKQIALLKTFADQAVIAIENVRLFNETKEALEQQTATAEILKVISSSPTDVQPVFDEIVKSGVHLFGGLNVTLRLVKGDLVEAVASSQVNRDAADSFAVPINDDRFISPRAIMRREVVHVPDMRTAEWANERMKRRGEQRGWRAILCAPMLRESIAIGAITVTRATPGPFTDKQIALLKTFADQAVIAIENVRLFKEIEARNRDLGESLEQQTATAEVLRVISSSPTDIQPVLEAVAHNAARLCGANDVVIRLLDGDVHHGVAHYGPIPIVGPLTLHGSIAGRAMLNRKTVQIEDLLEPSVRAEFHEADATVGGYRTFLAAPLLREDSAIGAIVMRREQVSPFTGKQIALLETFAAQAVIAIENVRLFKELQARNADITEALQQQTATSEILQVISGSPTNVTPVLEAVARNAALLCETNDARVYVVDGDTLRYVGGFGDLEGALPGLPLTRGVVTGRAVIDRSVIHIDDLAAVLDEFSDARGPQQSSGTHTVLAVPLMREGEAFGALLMRRKDVRPFSEKQIALVKTFAYQAAIGIENVRLFKEIQEKGRQLEIANKHKSEFLANMSHELRTPLNAVIGFSEALVEKMFGELNPKQEDYLRDIHSSGRHLLSLINDILDLSKIEAGRMELELSEFSLPMALKNAMTLVRERAQTHSIDMKLHVDSKLGNIRADERKLKQIVLNLLSNAVKFTPDGGRVEVDARANGGSVKVSVKDTGVGIASKDQAALFEEFRQVGRASTGKREGTGLGLALTRRFVELHGGTIGVESTPGKGSTFTFTLPLNTVTSGRGRATRDEKRKTRT